MWIVDAVKGLFVGTSPLPAEELLGATSEDAVLWVVCGALVDDLGAPGRLMAARRTRPAHLAGRWELPGGKVDAGESLPEALRRELREELAVEIEIGTEVHSGSSDGIPGWPISAEMRLRCWTARVVAGAPTPGEAHDEVIWVSPQAWRELDWVPADVPVVQELFSGAPGAPRNVPQAP